ncbi:MAG: hypothetical protein HC777_02510, partial [Hyphomonadaceae bacterium]|nr:hypothetical protein [Hyphomonadaceae bacterium]
MIGAFTIKPEPDLTRNALFYSVFVAQLRHAWRNALKLTITLFSWLYTTTWVPNSTTRPDGMWKKSVALVAFLDMNIYRRSCHNGIPELADATIVRWPKKKLVLMMSNLKPCLRLAVRARGMLGLSIKP